MPFTVELERRDFSGPVNLDCAIQPVTLGWSAFGGPERAELVIRGAEERLVDLTGLLRCGVTVRDLQGEAVWWGYVDAVQVRLAGVTVSVAMKDLANRVSVRYAYLSTGGLPGETGTTPTAANSQSEREYGVKELVLQREDLDEVFAAGLRDTVLAQRAWPVSTLSRRSGVGASEVRLICAGWFRTLAWRHYAHEEGFYANTGPGPGAFAFGNSAAALYPAQSFTPGADGALKTATFMLRNVGGATRTLTARLHADASGSPGAVLATSDPLDPSGLPPASYAWAQFSFAGPVPLTGGSAYWVSLNPNGVNAGQYFMLRLDQNMAYAGGEGRYYDSSAGTWLAYPPGDRPDALFRFVCVADTGDQLAEIAAVGGQFFPRITTQATGILTSSYRAGGLNCLQEVEKLMRLGTADQRLVLASVSPERHLRFYSQPDPQAADIYLDREGRFYTKEGDPLKPWQPPVGRFARLMGSARINLPWDRYRLPACFVGSVEYWVESGRVRVGRGEQGGGNI
ncbi:MAG: hypothetical protein H0S79_10710 [Anaerolineaceae bacterium]|nr:hypothetical protein [Anaerolineaceae bacterium]